jgi:tetraacyldisaccharide 4'-kinase
MNRALLPVSWLYGWVVSRRRAKLRRLPPWRLPVPVISVGNITVGGTGKTEAVAYLCRHFMAQGIKPGILSRGYHRRSRVATLVVSKGVGPEVSVAEAGDEPYLLAQRLTGAAVVVGKDRWSTGMQAIQALGCRVLVLDDGFQRRDQLYRDLDIVLVDAADPYGEDSLLPAGRLREPLSALAEADVLIITRADQYPTAAVISRLSNLAPKALILSAQHTPANLISLNDGKKQSPEFLANRRVLAVSGIARPEAFEKTLASLGAEVTGHFSFPDHHWYSDAERKRIFLHAQALKAEIVTTSKDAVRLAWPKDWAIQGWALGVAFDIQGGAAKLNARVNKIISK